MLFKPLTCRELRYALVQAVVYLLPRFAELFHGGQLACSIGSGKKDRSKFGLNAISKSEQNQSLVSLLSRSSHAACFLVSRCNLDSVTPLRHSGKRAS